MFPKRHFKTHFLNKTLGKNEYITSNSWIWDERIWLVREFNPFDNKLQYIITKSSNSENLIALKDTLPFNLQKEEWLSENWETHIVFNTVLSHPQSLPEISLCLQSVGFSLFKALPGSSRLWALWFSRRRYSCICCSADYKLLETRIIHSHLGILTRPHPLQILSQWWFNLDHKFLQRHLTQMLGIHIYIWGQTIKCTFIQSCSILCN